MLTGMGKRGAYRPRNCEGNVLKGKYNGINIIYK
jgi:hypothetical protein